MAGFSEQREKLRKTLISSGLSADAAARIANVLGNGEQSLRHSGEVTIDTTPKDLRQVDGTKRKQRFPNLDFRDGDPDYRRRRTSKSERRRKKKRAPNVTSSSPPQADPSGATIGLVPGPLTDIGCVDGNAAVGVRHIPRGRPVGRLPVAMVDAASDAFVSKSPKAKVAPRDGSLRLDIRENNSELIWDLQLRNRVDLEVVSKIEYVPNVGLVITYAKLKTWGKKNAKTRRIRTVRQSVVSEVVEDSLGLRCERRDVAVLGSVRRPPEFFNVYRLGTFEGEWLIGDTKSVQQVWPTSEKEVLVLNMTQNVPNTPGQKSVLYAVRTQDEAANAKDDPKPHGPNKRRPPAEYYAIEIQGPPATTIDVVTGVSLTSSGLEFTRTRISSVWVDATACESGGACPLVIPITSCP